MENLKEENAEREAKMKREVKRFILSLKSIPGLGGYRVGNFSVEYEGGDFRINERYIPPDEPWIHGRAMQCRFTFIEKGTSIRFDYFNSGSHDPEWVSRLKQDIKDAAKAAKARKRKAARAERKALDWQI